MKPFPTATLGWVLRTPTSQLSDGVAGPDLHLPRLQQWNLNSQIRLSQTLLADLGYVGSDGSTGYGNAGIGIMDGPGQLNTDFSLGKTTVIGGVREDAVLAFRVEFYNALNRPQFSSPGTTLGTANFGVITQTSVPPASSNSA